RPGVEEVPARDLLPAAIEEDYRAVAAAYLAAHDVAMPLVELDVVGHPPLEDDVAVLGHPRQLPRRQVVAALAVLDHVGRRVEAAHLVEGGASDAVDLDEEVEVEVGIGA